MQMLTTKECSSPRTVQSSLGRGQSIIQRATTKIPRSSTRTATRALRNLRTTTLAVAISPAEISPMYSALQNATPRESRLTGARYTSLRLRSRTTHLPRHPRRRTQHVAHCSKTAVGFRFCRAYQPYDGPGGASRRRGVSVWYIAVAATLQDPDEGEESCACDADRGGDGQCHVRFGAVCLSLGPVRMEIYRRGLLMMLSGERGVW